MRYIFGQWKKRMDLKKKQKREVGDCLTLFNPVTHVFWSGIALLVRNSSIRILLFLVKLILELTRFICLKRSQ